MKDEEWKWLRRHNKKSLVSLELQFASRPMTYCVCVCPGKTRSWEEDLEWRMGGVVVERLLILLVGGGRHDWRTIDAKTKTNGEICSHWERKMKLERIRRKRWKFFFFLYRIADGELRLSISQLGTFLILRMRDVAAAKSHQFPPSFFQPTLIFAPEFSRPATPSILNRLFFVSHFSWKIIRTEKKQNKQDWEQQKSVKPKHPRTVRPYS